MAHSLLAPPYYEIMMCLVVTAILAANAKGLYRVAQRYRRHSFEQTSLSFAATSVERTGFHCARRHIAIRHAELSLCILCLGHVYTALQKSHAVP
ncbi:MAG: hypothetical protein ACI8W7_003227 [Gammaproteobacteria bacterium]|jgi:hypothetical protein